MQVLLFFSMIITGCKNDDSEKNPAARILGKWEIISVGNYPQMEPYPSDGYTEYLQDSVIHEYVNSTGIETYRKYYIDSLLHDIYTREDGRKIETKYYYKFYNNKLQLDFANVSAIHNTFIYKRIQ